jgi:hypothetical protein
MRTSGTPHVVGRSGSATPLERVGFGEAAIKEGFLQELLHENPSLLPVASFEGNFGPLVSLGREIMAIDNLFISPAGRLTVVETKLWRNPQATRTVLAQILDYAARLSRLGLEELEAICRAASQCAMGADDDLYRFVARHVPDQVPPEAEFIDRVQRDLRNGRFLLLIVGDGIREGLERILEALHDQARLHFTFGLVELQLYREAETRSMFVVPSVIAHSTEIERAVVTIRGATVEQIDVAARSGPGAQTPKLTEQEFLESIKDPVAARFGQELFEWARKRARVEIAKGGNSAAVRVPFSTTSGGLILLRMFKSGKVRMTPPRLKVVLKKSGLGDAEVLRIARQLQSLYPQLEINAGKDQVCPEISAAELLPRLEEVLEIYTDAIERLEALDPGLEGAPINDASQDPEDEDA